MDSTENLLLRYSDHRQAMFTRMGLIKNEMENIFAKVFFESYFTRIFKPTQYSRGF
tara:strand:- start:260 stop:427 length:168 start_codon:yes stop_codon:yes gene_type:complete